MFFSTARRRWRYQAASYEMGTKDYLPSVNRVEREADILAPFSDEVKNGGAIPPLPIRLSSVLPN
jgi:hypothetical protein